MPVCHTALTHKYWSEPRILCCVGQRSNGHRGWPWGNVQSSYMSAVPCHSALASDNVNATKYICTQYCCVFGLRWPVACNWSLQDDEIPRAITQCDSDLGFHHKVNVTIRKCTTDLLCKCSLWDLTQQSSYEEDTAGIWPSSEVFVSRKIVNQQHTVTIIYSLLLM